MSAPLALVLNPGFWIPSPRLPLPPPQLPHCSACRGVGSPSPARHLCCISAKHDPPLTRSRPSDALCCCCPPGRAHSPWGGCGHSPQWRSSSSLGLIRQLEARCSPGGRQPPSRLDATVRRAQCYARVSSLVHSRRHHRDTVIRNALRHLDSSDPSRHGDLENRETVRNTGADRLRAPGPLGTSSDPGPVCGMPRNADLVRI